MIVRTVPVAVAFPELLTVTWYLSYSFPRPARRGRRGHGHQVGQILERSLAGGQFRGGQSPLQREVRRLAGRECPGEVHFGRVGQRRIGDERRPRAFVTGRAVRTPGRAGPGAVVAAADPVPVESGQGRTGTGHRDRLDRRGGVVDDADQRVIAAVVRPDGRVTQHADRFIGVDHQQDLATRRGADGRALGKRRRRSSGRPGRYSRRRGQARADGHGRGKDIESSAMRFDHDPPSFKLAVRPGRLHRMKPAFPV